MDREDIESRRAENQFWNGAENYQLRSDFQMYRPDGEADQIGRASCMERV